MGKAIVIGKDKFIMVKVQSVESKSETHKRYGSSRSLTIRGDVTVEEVFKVVEEALAKWAEVSGE